QQLIAELEALGERGDKTRLHTIELSLKCLANEEL
nr:hypothetical protein [Tanacetum cinerariifolium]